MCVRRISVRRGEFPSLQLQKSLFKTYLSGKKKGPMLLVELVEFMYLKGFTPGGGYTSIG